MIEQTDKNASEMLKNHPNNIHDNYIANVYQSSNPPNTDGISISLGECEVVLRREYNIPDNENLIIAQYEIIDNISLINQIEYKVYRQNGMELNLIVCRDVDIDIIYPIKVELIDFDLVEEMYQNTYDIFNTSNLLYLDPCFPFYYKKMI